jgi:hypothetical protein
MMFSADQCVSEIQFGRYHNETKQGGVLINLGYRRWVEFDATNGTGQDAAVIRFDDDHVVGLVADGVSQSFYGDIAAREVTDHLLEMLWNRRQQPLSSDDLATFLRKLETPVHALVEQQALSGELNELVRDALEATREQGSQTVFAAFVLDLWRRSAIIYQAGDVSAVIHTEGAAPTVTQGRSGRWSSAGHSKLNLETIHFSSVSAIVLHSDGLPSQWGVQETDIAPSDEYFREQAGKRAIDDDVSFVSVVMPASSTSRPAPNRQGSVESPRAEMKWQAPVPATGAPIDRAKSPVTRTDGDRGDPSAVQLNKPTYSLGANNPSRSAVRQPEAERIQAQTSGKRGQPQSYSSGPRTNADVKRVAEQRSGRADVGSGGSSLTAMADMFIAWLAKFGNWFFVFALGVCAGFLLCLVFLTFANAR